MRNEKDQNQQIAGTTLYCDFEIILNIVPGTTVRLWEIGPGGSFGTCLFSLDASVRNPTVIYKCKQKCSGQRLLVRARRRGYFPMDGILELNLGHNSLILCQQPDPMYDLPVLEAMAQESEIIKTKSFNLLRANGSWKIHL